MSRAILGIVALCAVTLAATPSASVSADTVRVGDAAPAFFIDTLDGISMTADFHGRPAYINVFATWCPPCRREMPSILQQAKEYGDRIVFLFVDEQEAPTKVKSFATSVGLLTPIAVDGGQFAATFNVHGLPESIFIDRHGIVRYIQRGSIPDDVLADQLGKLASDSDNAIAVR